MKKLLKILFTFSLVCLFTFAFVQPLNMVGNPLKARLAAGGWYQQFLPVPTGGPVKDMYFVDSLLGFVVSDSNIYKTTNGGNTGL